MFTPCVIQKKLLIWRSISCIVITCNKVNNLYYWLLGSHFLDTLFQLCNFLILFLKSILVANKKHETPWDTEYIPKTWMKLTSYSEYPKQPGHQHFQHNFLFPVLFSIRDHLSTYENEKWYRNLQNEHENWFSI